MHEKYKKFQCINPKCDFAFWKIMGGRQLEPPEADTLLKDREIGPLEGFRSKLGRPFSAKLKLTDANEVEFDFGNAAATTTAKRRTSPARSRSGACPEVRRSACSRRPMPMSAKRRSAPRGPATSARAAMILQRPIERAQMEKLLATGKTDLLQFVSARTRRPFSAFLVRQKDGKVGFEFEPKDPTQGRRAARRRARPRARLGAHPKDRQPVELHAARYGPYVKHGAVNATLPDKRQGRTR